MRSNERPKVSPARIPRRRPRSTRAQKTPRPAPEPGAPAGARRISGRMAQRTSTCRAIARSSAAPSAATSALPTSATSPLPPLRHRPPRVRPVRIVRSRQPIRVHADHPGPNFAEEHQEQLHTVLAAHDGRARDHDASHRRRAARRSTICSSFSPGALNNAPALGTGPEIVATHLAAITRPVTDALLHPDHRSAGHGPDRQAGAGRGGQPQRPASRSRK